jgi:hypothetical protein
MKFVRENPLASDNDGATRPGDKLPGPIAHHGPILVLHRRAQIGVDMRSTDKGRDWGWCRWRHRGDEDQVIRKHPKTHLGPSDHSMRIHQRSHRYGRRRSSIRRRQSKACGHRWHGLPRSLGLDDRRGRPLTRWWTIHCRRRCSSRAWRSRSRCSGTRRSWGRLSLMRRSRHHRGRTGPKSRRDGQCEQRSHKWLEAQGNQQGGLASRRGGRTCRGSQVLVAETVEPDSKKI